MVEVTETQVLAYINELYNVHDKYFKEHYKYLESPKFYVMKGKKYMRIVKERGQKTVHCFLDAFGNIYKADSWKRPAKGIRGNILNDTYPLFGQEFYKK